MRRTYIIWTVALCMAICISIFSYSTEEIQAATGSFNVTPSTPSPTPSPTPTASSTPTLTATPTIPPVTPTPSPSPTSTFPTVTPTPSSTPTATPTVTTVPTPTIADGGSNQPSISLKLSINIMGQKTEWLCTTEGKILEDITATSSDGKLTLRISKNTFALDANGEPLTAINIIDVDPLVKSPPLIPPTDHFLIYIYEFLPDAASFSEPIEIEINYNTSDLPKSHDELTLQMCTLSGVPNEWEVLPGLSDTETNTVICPTNHLSIYALIAAPLEEATSTSQPMPAPTTTEPHTSSLILLILILPIASLTFFIYVLLRQRRSNSADENDNS
jgi:hypothetical protein